MTSELLRLTILVSAIRHGLIVRAISDTIALAPPLVISESEVDPVADIVSASVRRAEAELARN